MKEENEMNEKIDTNDICDDDVLKDSIAEAKRIASLLRNESGDDSIPTAIVDIANAIHLSVLLRRFNSGGNVSGYLIINEEQKKKFGTDRIVVLDLNEPVRRRNVLLAKMIGYYLFIGQIYKQQGPHTKIFLRNDVGGMFDKNGIIDQFTCELLMPEKEFVEKYNEIKSGIENHHDKVQKLAGAFMVPLDLVELRIKELELGQENQK